MMVKGLVTQRRRGENVGKIVVLSTGGTIASRGSGTPGGSVARDGVQDLLGQLPHLGVHLPNQPTNLHLEGRDLLNKGSYLLTLPDMAFIAAGIAEALRDDDTAGVVVTHGTDTMEETAFLADLYHDDRRPVVFTGAQRPADATDTDGPRNLADAIAVAAAESARNRGVLIVFDGRIHPATGTRKSQTLAAVAFHNPDGFIGHVRDHTVRFVATPDRQPSIPRSDMHARVDIVALYPGADTAALDAVVDAGATGVILEATGAGNANHSIVDRVAELTARGIVVGLSTRVAAGPVVPLYGNGGGVDLVKAGAIPTGLLKPSQARILLAALLSSDPATAGERLKDYTG